jgi:tRNA U54 and U55 pseudouridine synthase Pus10
MTRFDRALRRRLSKRFARRRSKSEAADTSDQLIDASTPQEVTSVRAKSQRHRKVTADKWNQ